MHITDWWNTCGCWNIKRAEHKGRKELHLWEQVCSLGKKLGHEGMLRAISLLLGGVLGCLLIIRLFSPLMLVKPLLLSLLLMWSLPLLVFDLDLYPHLDPIRTLTLQGKRVPQCQSKLQVMVLLSPQMLLK
jgi:hypothetical protein|uniref:Uncharacterized protein n=1 Tax=Picea glauca TaxID=3330 RepID=A0A101LZN7_PICGL|nr:hypothetical protein ABT39_MTgene5295 [Picea glauca]QHR88871.1 hypothetical protein Q903MT_gene2890 [Picea sitchensis]